MVRQNPAQGRRFGPEWKKFFFHEKLDKISRNLEKKIIEKFQVKVPKMKIQKSAQTKFSTEWESHVLILLVVHASIYW